MPDGLEEFFQKHEHTVAALEAVSTFAVVVISLALALISQRTNRTRVKAYASINKIVHSTLEGKEHPRYVTATIRNIGIMPVSIPLSFFHWIVPFKRGGWSVIPLDYSQSDEWVQQKKYPTEITPRASQTFFLTEIGMFREMFRDIFAEAGIFQRWQFYFFRARVITDDGKMFNVDIAANLRKELRALLIAAAAPEKK